MIKFSGVNLCNFYILGIFMQKQAHQISLIPFLFKP